MKIEYSQHVVGPPSSGPPSSHSGGGGGGLIEMIMYDNVCEDDKLG